MVIRLGRNGRFLACSTYPDHKETRPLPGEEPPAQEGEGEPCPKCGEGVLATKRGRFGAFLGCSRYPDCDYIRKEGPPPPEPLAFEVTCPKNRDGHLVPRRARRTGNVFWGCSAYPKCDYTTNFEPVGAVHDADEGPVARKAESGMCLVCGADVPLPEGDLIGRRLEGGPANPEALQRPARGGARRTTRTGGRTKTSTGDRANGTRRGGRSEAAGTKPGT